MEYKRVSNDKIRPRLIIHGGAGNITKENLSPTQYAKFHSALLTILANTHAYQLRGHSALDTVTYAVTQLENNPLFNSGHGAVFTRDGVNELECSVMVSRGKKKRGVGLMGLQHVKNPIKLAREMLIRGEDDLEGGNGEHRGPLSAQEIVGQSSGAQGHDQMFGAGAEKLAKEWGIELVDPSYFFVQNRWDEHIKGLEREKNGGQASYCAVQYVPQGTCGAVALDEDGVCAVATSTGGMTNKLTGRIGDTPTLGAGFWAEEWQVVESWPATGGTINVMKPVLEALIGGCFTQQIDIEDETVAPPRIMRSTAMSGTGNGDSFLRLAAVRTASAIAQYRGDSLCDAIAEITGPGGQLQKSAGKRWKKTGEGEGGIIGIESKVVETSGSGIGHHSSSIVDDYNCGGMFRAYIDDSNKAICRVWRKGQHDSGEDYEGEGKSYEWRDWVHEKPPLDN